MSATLVPVSTRPAAARLHRHGALPRVPYAAALLGLLGLQYVLKAGCEYLLTGAWHGLAEELTPDTVAERMRAFSQPTDTGVFRVLVTLLFLWMGTLLTLRRARDAGVSPLFALLFFVPELRYAVMAAFCWLPSRRPGSLRREQSIASLLFGAVGAPSLLLATAISHRCLRHEGGDHLLLLVLGAPFLMGLLTAWRHARRRAHAFSDAVGTGLLSSVLGWSLLLLISPRWLLLVVTLGPVVLALALPGALLGAALARWRRAPTHQGRAARRDAEPEAQVGVRPRAGCCSGSPPARAHGRSRTPSERCDCSCRS